MAETYLLILTEKLEHLLAKQTLQLWLVQFNFR
jgi:hypothetical protein